MARKAKVMSAVLAGATLWTASALADEQATVVVLEPSDPAAAAREATTRIGAELRAAGFRVVVTHASAAVSRDDLERALSEARGVAAIAVEGRPGSTLADVWVSDRVTGKLSIRPVETRGAGDTPALLAIRAVELLRASLLELHASKRVEEDAGPQPAAVEKLAAPPTAAGDGEPELRRRGGFSLLAGVTGLFNTDGAAPAVGPRISLGGAAAMGLGGRATFIGPTGGARMSGALGRASLSQALGLAELTYTPPTRSVVYGTASAGVGFLHLSARGDLKESARARSSGATAFATTFGGAFGLDLSRHFALQLDAFVVLTAPRIVVDMGEERLGSVGRPTLGTSLSLASRF